MFWEEIPALLGDLLHVHKMRCIGELVSNNFDERREDCELNRCIVNKIL